MTSPPFKRAGLMGLMALALGAPAADAQAVDFTPFAKVEDVCPKCAKASEDTVTLSSGEKLKAKIVAESASFLVLLRYGEVRMLPQSRVQSVDWGKGTRGGDLTGQDQLVLTNGHILTGAIIEEKTEPVAYFRLQSSTHKQSFVVFKDQVQEAYKSGQRYSFERPASKAKKR